MFKYKIESTFIYIYIKKDSAFKLSLYITFDFYSTVTTKSVITIL